MVDDDPIFRKITQTVLLSKGWEVMATENPDDFFKAFNEDAYTMGLIDLQIKTKSGLDVIEKAIKRLPEFPMMICTAHGSIDSAVTAMKLGAVDYISKPVNFDELLIKINNIYHNKSRDFQLTELQNQFQTIRMFNDFIGKNSSLKNIIAICKTIINTDLLVLIYGETGTGKEIFARAFHYESNRSKRPFVVVNCAAIQENLLESELFGHEKGSFTGAIERKLGKFEIAENGTLFLDEIGELSKSLQKKLLRVLQEKEFERIGSSKVLKSHCRVVAATNRNLKELIQKQTFREDLYFRLNVFPITLPPLKERKEDILELVSYFVCKFCKKYKKNLLNIPKSFLKTLKNYSFPGNVRELEHMIERCVIISKGEVIDHFNLNFMPSDENYEDFNDIRINDYISNCEKKYFKNMLKKHEWNTLKVAEISGVSRKTVYQRINEYHLKEEML